MAITPQQVKYGQFDGPFVDALEKKIDERLAARKNYNISDASVRITIEKPAARPMSQAFAQPVAARVDSATVAELARRYQKVGWANVTLVPSTMGLEVTLFFMPAPTSIGA